MPSLNTGNAILSNPIKVDSSYNVGIGGAASGSFKLQVTGTTNLTGTVTLATTSGVLAVNTTGRPSGVGGGDNGKIWSKQATTGNYGIATIASATDSFTYIGHNGTDALLGTSYGTTGAYTDLVLQTADTTRFRLSGSTGAATFSSSVTAKSVKIENTSAASFLYFNNTAIPASNYIALGSAANELYFQVNGSDRMVIKDNGNVGIGTNSPAAKLEIQDGHLRLYHAVSTAGAGYAVIWASNNGGTNTSFATIEGVTTSEGNRTGDIKFNTSSAGAPTEKMRITSGGYLKATSTGTYNDVNAQNYEFVNGTASANSFFVGNTNTSYSGATLLRINGSRTTTNGTYNLIGATNGNSTGEFLVRDSGNCLNTNNSYTGTSDIKLKQDIIDASSQWEDIKQMRIRKFRFKKQVEQDENAPYLLGVIAQELELVSPNLVDETLDFDGTGEELTSTTKSVKYSIIYMKAVKALQESMQRIENLEAQIEELKQIVATK